MNPDIAGAKLGKELSSINLFYVYKAVNVVQERELFTVHDNPNPECPVGRNIQETIEPLFTAAQLAMEKVLGSLTLEDVVKSIATKENRC